MEKLEIKERFGNNLYKIIEKRGLSCKDVAKALGLSNERMVYAYCDTHDLRMPSIEKLKLLKDLLNVSLDDLMA
jgi:transcriptional regulator with XRE-family HTH domain